jgi:4-oxalocrotonate tautomerase
VITEHEPSDFIVDPTYLGIERSADCIILQITLNEGRTTDQKRAFYRAIADGLHSRLGVRREDVFISLVEVRKKNRSFGKGVAQYAE